MILRRHSNSIYSKHEQASTEWESYDGAEATVGFREFGAGSERFSRFEIRVAWEDVEKIIDAMADKGHAAARRVRKAIKLAEAVKAIAEN